MRRLCLADKLLQKVVGLLQSVTELTLFYSCELIEVTDLCDVNPILYPNLVIRTRSLSRHSFHHAAGEPGAE